MTTEMTVQELIEQLKAMPSDAKVYYFDADKDRPVLQVELTEDSMAVLLS